MAQPFPSVQFEIKRDGATVSTWRVERSPGDSLSSLLAHLSAKSGVKTEDFSFVFQGEVATLEAGELRYFAEAVRGETKVLASGDRVAEVIDIAPDVVLSTNVQISALADVVCPAGLCPVITIDSCLVFFELDGSEALDGSAMALDDARVVAWIEAFRLTGIRGEAGPVVLLRAATSCVDVRSGEAFVSHSDFLIASRTPVNAVKVEMGVILIRHGSRLPKWPIAPDLSAHIALRAGAAFRIQNGHIQAAPAPVGPPSKRWLYPDPIRHHPDPSRHLPDPQAHALRRQIMNFISS